MADFKLSIETWVVSGRHGTPDVSGRHGTPDVSGRLL
jgi:hypothetical protein